jgi:hypothetical protein
MASKRSTWGWATRFASLTVVIGALVIAVAGQAAAASSSVLAPDDLNRIIPKTTVSTPLGVQADGLRWQAMADAYQARQDRPASSYYTPQALKAQGMRMQAMAQAYEQQTGNTVSSSSSGGFDWRDGLIGVAGGIGLAICAAGLALVAVRTRRQHVPA